MSVKGRSKREIISFKVGKYFLPTERFVWERMTVERGREGEKREERRERKEREKRRREPMSNQCYYQTKQSKRKQTKRQKFVTKFTWFVVIWNGTFWFCVDTNHITVLPNFFQQLIKIPAMMC